MALWLCHGAAGETLSTRLVWRRSATAIGMYGGAALGVLATLVAARELRPHAFGLFAIVIAAAGFFQILLDLTVEEAMIKFGFRYTTSERWGRLRRLYTRGLVLKTIGALFASAALAIAAPFADSIFSAHHLLVPMLIGAALPIALVPESLAGAALVLTGRYDVRAGFLFLTPALRLGGIVAGARYGVEQAVLGLVIGQAVASLAVGWAALYVFRRFPAAASERLDDDRPEIFRFVLQSSIATGVVSLRGAIVPVLLGIVTSPTQVGFFRAAQAPQTGLAALTSPARLIMLTEQTRDWEAGSTQSVFAGVRRFSLAAFALMVVAVPPMYVFMPDLVRIFYGSAYSPASDAARLMLLAGALQLIVAWTKSLPVSIGRPGLRIVTHGIETVVVIPLVIVLGRAWNATGAAAATLIAAGVFVAVWVVAFERIRREPAPPRAAHEPVPL
jgi:O-antigen/teichoic acid export membrane protein